MVPLRSGCAGVNFEAKLENLENIKHGRRAKIFFKDYHYIFDGVPAGFEAGLYHSWALSEKNFPRCFTITAVNDENIIMAISHKNLNISGVQFHPESIMTSHGIDILRNWLKN